MKTLTIDRDEQERLDCYARCMGDGWRTEVVQLVSTYGLREVLDCIADYCEVVTMQHPIAEPTQPRPLRLAKA